MCLGQQGPETGQLGHGRLSGTHLVIFCRLAFQDATVTPVDARSMRLGWPVCSGNRAWLTETTVSRVETSAPGTHNEPTSTARFHTCDFTAKPYWRALSLSHFYTSAGHQRTVGKHRRVDVNLLSVNTGST
jgi:hypothetical protein